MREAVIVEAVRTPIGRRNGKLKDLHPVVLGSLILKELVRRAGIEPQGISAELIARKYKVSRREMDEFGVQSHHRAHEATDKGYMRSQIMPVEVPVEGNGHVELFEKDEGIRANASYEAAAGLQPAFNSEHSITAA